MVKNVIVIILVSVIPILSSGGYDHGTSTGKGQLELDFTWNPFNLIEFGQTYVVIGYGLTNYLDIHGYYAHQTDKDDNYYYGLFYQFIDTKFLDLATAIGRRQYIISDINDLFFQQFLFNIKVSKDLSVGGAFVNIHRITNSSLKFRGTAFDVAIYIPLSSVVKLPKFVSELKLALGIFNPGVFEPDHGDFLPTYSLDITFKKFCNNK